MRKREAENVASCRNRDVLDPIDCVSHRRSMHRLAGVEVPECLPVRASTASSDPASSPKNTNPPAVVSVPPHESPWPTCG